MEDLLDDIFDHTLNGEAEPVVALTQEALAAAGLRDGVKVFVGGAPVTPEYASRIGADGCAPNASALVRACKAMLAAS
jgi:5-methyltetrahydrofolate--homocysteine methyltransferase